VISTASPHTGSEAEKLLRRAPMTLARLVSQASGISACGIPKESTTWLITSARVGSAPRATTTRAGSTVTRRRSHSGTVPCRKPRMIVWPANVATAEADRPEASSETAKMTLDARPRIGVNVR
jgi:hypothetical protein